MKITLFILFAVTAMSFVKAYESTYPCIPCKCFDTYYGHVRWWLKRLSECRHVNLTAVPTNFQHDTEVVYIHDATMPMLRDNAFASYRLLQQIIIYTSKLEHIEPGAFRHMSNVIKVELDHNKIKILRTQLFSNMTHLTHVYLMFNEITTIEERCFVNVPQLEEINLYENKLMTLDMKFIDNPNRLKRLVLTYNPWHCDTSLCGVMDTFVSRNKLSYTGTPDCTTPQNLTDLYWSDSMVTKLCPCFPHNCTIIPPEPSQLNVTDDIYKVLNKSIQSIILTGGLKNELMP